MAQYKVVYTDADGIAQAVTMEKNAVKSAWTAAKKIAGKQFSTVTITKEEI